MRSFHVKPAVYHEDGAINYGIAKCIMPIPGSSKEKTGDGTKTRIIIVCALVVVILVAATILGYQKEVGKPPLLQELYSSLGKPIADVAAQLDVPQEEMRQIEPRLYCVPAVRWEYADVTFDMLLYFEGNEHLLRDFGYVASYNADTEQVAESIAAIAEALSVDELTLSNGTVLSFKEEKLKTYLVDNGAINIDEKMGTFGELQKNLHIDYQTQTQAATIELWYTNEADRKIDY